MSKFSKLLLAGLFAYGTVNCFADANSAKPMRVGPVQNYGSLGTDGGKVISTTTKKPVMLRGLSLFWSDATGVQYYNDEVISWVTENLGIDIFRFAMGIEYYDSNGGKQNPMDSQYSYKGAPESYLSLLDKMVEAAIKNDVYIIVDWHSHRANEEQTEALAFFQTVAEKYANVPNVIFEIFNEPVRQQWSVIQGYANTVSAGIRKYSQNLILVGTPNWSQMTNYGGVNATNVAYVLHFYAGSHSAGSYGGKAKAAMSSGNAVFVSEWGTTNADGDGTPNQSATQAWFDWMEENQVSNCNWSLRQSTSSVDNSSEQSALFAGSTFLTRKADLESAEFSASGKIVSEYLKKHRGSWEDSLVAGKHSGTCAFDAIKSSETETNVTLPSGCSYTTSDENVVTSSGEIKGPGFAILTAADGSKSVVTIVENPRQTFTNFKDFTCRYGGNCSIGKMTDLTNAGQGNELSLSTYGKTQQGAKVTVKSLDTKIVSIKEATCSNSTYCYGDALNNKILMYEFTQTLGSAKVVATADAVAGYQALNDTITATFAKALPRLSSKFKKMTLALGATATDALPDTTQKDQLQVTYLFNGEKTSPFVTKVGSNLVAGNKDAIVDITAMTPETDYYEAMSVTVRVIIGDASKAENNTLIDDEDKETDAIKAWNASIPFRAEMQNSGLILQVEKTGNVGWSIYTLNGKKMLSNSAQLSAGTHWISIESLPAGAYYLKVQQGTFKNYLQFNKR